MSVETAERKDIKLGHEVARRPDGPLAHTMAKAAKMGDQEPLYFLAGAMTAAGLILRRPRLLEAGVRIGVAVGAADLLKSLLKRTVSRTRPHVLLDDGRYERTLGGSGEKQEQSFPSGHVAGSVAAANAARRVYPGSALYSIAACAALGWSRVREGQHWPSDVLAGLLVGLVAEITTGAVVKKTAAFVCPRGG